MGLQDQVDRKKSVGTLVVNCGRLDVTLAQAVNAANQACALYDSSVELAQIEWRPAAAALARFKRVLPAPRSSPRG